ncbi:hypothetical protein ACFLX7_05130 [Chloroflexota bacterium]
MKGRFFHTLLLITLTASLVFGTLGQPTEVHAANTAATYPSAAVSTIVGSYNGAPWLTPTNAGADDSTTTNVGISALDKEPTEQLDATDFGFAIPLGSTIDGIVLEYDRFSPDVGADVTDTLVQLRHAGALVGINKAAGAGWATTETIVTFGTSSDVWGTTLTAAQINESTFGVSVVATTITNNSQAEIDFLRITVYYTPAADISFIPDVVFAESNKVYLVNPQSADSSVYSYGASHPVLEGRH